MDHKAIQSLTEVGLNRLEAVIYFHLCREPALTGYAVAQTIGKPVPNVYKALESLQKKGVIVCDESASHRRYTPLPIGGYLQQLEDRLRATSREVERQLAEHQTLPLEGGVFRLEHADQVYGQARIMAQGATCVIMVDACPGQVERLHETLETVAGSGIEVYVKAYSRIDIAKCHVAFSEEIGSPHGRWAVDWLHCCVDGRQHLTALFERESGRLVHSLWCKDTFLSGVAHNGLLAELMLTQVVQRLEGGGSPQESLAELHRFDRVRTGKLSPVQDLIDSFMSHSGGHDDVA
jgi:sugar-specific transcriptional regulator TrmB